jgi:hypothetical protein
MILIEGPDWGDATFFGNWLLAAADVDRFHREAVKAPDPNYCKAVERLEVVSELSFSWWAMHFIEELGTKGVTMSICADSQESEYIAMMSQMGFFTQTGDRYQMTVPSHVDIQTVKRSILALAETEDSDYVIHTEVFVHSLPSSEAKWWQDTLARMNDDQRLVDRAILLE